jgi:hypothetical protein
MSWISTRLTMEVSIRSIRARTGGAQPSKWQQLFTVAFPHIESSSGKWYIEKEVELAVADRHERNAFLVTDKLGPLGSRSKIVASVHAPIPVDIAAVVTRYFAACHVVAQPRVGTVSGHHKIGLDALAIGELHQHRS